VALVARSRQLSRLPSRPRGFGAAAAEDFYRGKTVTLFAGQPPGGGIDSEMRLVARFIGKFIPGEPNILPMNMQGAGGIILGNHLYSVAKPDGLTLGMPGRSGFALAPVISAADTKYDLRKFTWIGSSASSNFVLGCAGRPISTASMIFAGRSGDRHRQQRQHHGERGHARGPSPI